MGKERAHCTDDMTEIQSSNDYSLQHLAKFWAPGVYLLLPPYTKLRPVTRLPTHQLVSSHQQAVALRGIWQLSWANDISAS